MGVDHVAHLHREIVAFELAVREVRGPAPVVTSCPGWSIADLVLHLGGVHRLVTGILRLRLTELPASAGAPPPPTAPGWPDPRTAPNREPLPASLLDWFTAGTAELEQEFSDIDPGERVWTWSPPDQTVRFWQRMQAIEAAVHRWDAEATIGEPAPVAEELAADAVGQTFEVMVPARRSWQNGPAGNGERMRFRQTDGPGDWLVHFDGDQVRQDGDTSRSDVEFAGTASDLMLFLWQRLPADRLAITGDQTLARRYFTLVPPM